MIDSPVVLEDPGKGLPAVEAFLARHVVFPVVCRVMSQSKAINEVVQTGQAVLERFETMSTEQQVTQVLIPRITGLEDSSRFWSPLMVIEHLFITGTGMLFVAEQLAKGEFNDLPEVKIEAVKPSQEGNQAQILESYRVFLAGYSRAASIIEGDLSVAHYHPWFGFLNYHQWLCLNAMHHEIHFKQLSLINDKFVSV